MKGLFSGKYVRRSVGSTFKNNDSKIQIFENVELSRGGGAAAGVVRSALICEIEFR
jgi:hypothetical protein